MNMEPARPEEVAVRVLAGGRIPLFVTPSSIFCRRNGQQSAGSRLYFSFSFQVRRCHMHIIRFSFCILLSLAAADFGALNEQVKSDYEAGRFGSSYKVARELTAIIAMMRAETIRAAVPEAPEGYEKMPVKKDDDVCQNRMLAAMAAGIGTVVEQVYKGADGRITATVTADSPVIAMFNTMFGNPALLGKNQELVKYGDTMAVFETNGERRTL